MHRIMFCKYPCFLIVLLSLGITSHMLRTTALNGCVRVGNNFNVYWFVWGRWGSRNECLVVAAQKHKCAKFHIVTHFKTVKMWVCVGQRHSGCPRWTAPRVISPALQRKVEVEMLNHLWYIYIFPTNVFVRWKAIDYTDNVLEGCWHSFTCVTVTSLRWDTWHRRH